MQIKKAEVENFRKLKNVTIDLDDSVTLIVGRNNSGKTSLSEVFNKFLYEKLTVPVPPLDVQKRIVNVLDNFEKICSDRKSTRLNSSHT